MFNYFKKKQLEKQYNDFAKLYNIKVKKSGQNAYVIKGNNAIKVKLDAYCNDAIVLFSHFFDQIEPETKIIGFKKMNVVDYTKPKLHKLKNDGLSFYFSSFAEGISSAMDYLKKYNLKEGDVVFDCGAYCGITSYCFSKLVGETGKVYAFEPDPQNHEMLLKNIELHNLKNVIPVKKGIWSKTDTLYFNIEGALGSSLVEISTREKPKTDNKIEVTSIYDAICEYNIPKVDFIKMDIEGAEINALEGIKDYLKDNNVNFAIASYHIVDNEKTYKKLEPIFKEIGYYCETIKLYSYADIGSLVTYASKNPLPVVPSEKIVTTETKPSNNEVYNTILDTLKETNFQKNLDAFAKKYKDKNVILYGAGMVCDVLFENFDMSGLNTIAVSDKKYKDEAETYKNIPAIPPEKIAEKRPDIVLTTLQNSSIAKNYFEEDLFKATKKFKYRSIFD